MKITKDQAKKFILSRQGLLGKYRFIGKDGAYRYVRQAGCIQYDPVDVCGKNAELTLLSRVKGFTRQTLSDLLYKDRLLVDYSDKELSIWPREDWPYFAGYRKRSMEHGLQFPGIPQLEEQAVSYIRENGPVSSDTLPISGTIFWHSSMHWSGNWDKESKASRSVLEQLYTDGVLLIHHKNGSRKFYDLAENYFEKTLLQAENPCPDDAAFLKWRILRRIGAIGLLWNRRSDAWLGIDMTVQQREAAFSELEAMNRNKEADPLSGSLFKGGIIPVQVEGIRSPLYMLAEDVPLMEAVCRDEADLKKRLEFLAPLDPMLWDRKLVEAIWDFRYSWEIYTPAAKRRYGYYVLPILYGSSLIGRIEALAERSSNTLIVRNIWFEPGVKETKQIASALNASIRRLARFNDCTQISYR